MDKTTRRSTVFAREGLRLSGGDVEGLAQFRAEVHATCAAIGSPRVLVSILVQALAPAAAAAAAPASYALRGAADVHVLAALR
ncbi:MULTISPECIES: hypothetical protein [Streptomyces]|uniref:hypothetical protein n=1 Tax=Streptomyces TaxID=1883 RepID=UPI00068DD6D9|nr:MULTISPECIES: hypothetical protein [Streptomyces]